MPKRRDDTVAKTDKPPVSIQRRSANRKLSPVKLVRVKSSRRPRPIAQGPFVVSTYVSIEATCPDSCAYKANGCYVEGMNGYTFVGTLDQKAVSGFYTGLETIMLEAELIDRLYPMRVPRDGYKGRGRDMRLHVSGDVSCANGASMLGQAADLWGLRGGGQVWTYTHRWREVPRSAWGRWVNVLASIERVEDIEAAEAQGYVPAITLTYFPTERAFKVPGRPDRKVVPCPAETRGRTCVECRLCLNEDRLRRLGLIIGFSLHGTNKAAAARSLRVLQGGAFDSVPLELKLQNPK